MSLGDEKELLLISNNSKSNPSINNVVATEPSPSPEQQEITILKPKTGGILALLKHKSKPNSKYQRLPIMAESSPKMRFASSEQQQLTVTNVSSTTQYSQTPGVTSNKMKIRSYENNDEFVHAPESPSVSHLHYAYSHTSKDDLDLHTRTTHNISNQPRASAVNPISIPFHVSQRQITLDTDFDVPKYGKTRGSRSFSQGDMTPAASPTPNTKKKAKETFTKKAKETEDVTENEEKKTSDMMQETDEQIAADIVKVSKPPFLKRKSADNDSTDESSTNKRSMKDVFTVKKKSKEQGTPLSTVNETDKKEKKRKTKPLGPKGRELKKGKSVFDAFKKEKKPDLSNIKNLPMSLKTHLNDDSSDHAIQLILDHIRDLDEQKKDYIYEQLVKDKEFIPRICNKLLYATDAKHNEIVCIWLYDFFNESNPNARLFALQFIPCLIWCLMTRPPKCVSSVVATLLSLYKKECNIFDKLSYMLLDNSETDVSDLLQSDYGVSNHHNIFPKFEMPDLDLPSIYHEPNKNSSVHKNGMAPTLSYNSVASLNDGRNMEKKDTKPMAKLGNRLTERDISSMRNLIFPSLNQANLSTNLHLIYVALQVFNHYITRVSKPSICLEQMCAVIGKLCASGTDSILLQFPVVFAWEWKWYTDDMSKEKQTEKYILPSQIMSQFLSSIRYSLKQPKTRNIAKFALGQVHKRGHIDMIPEIILQTTSMLHSAFMDGLTF